MNFRDTLKKVYRLFHSHGVEKLVLPFVFSQKRIQTVTELSTQSISPASGPLRIWFHASSAGELESLWPLIVLAGTTGNTLPQTEIVVTILSESAWGALERLKQKLQEIGAKTVFLGYSPWEGGWGSWLDQIQPAFFITVKYEAWPDLWVSLQERKIPLVIIGARARNSLRIAKKITELLVGDLPHLLLFPCDPQDVKDLNLLFPKAILQTVDEPRWERVFDRSRNGNARAQELAQACRFLPRPWGVIGNAWLEDLKFLSSYLKRFQGTLWIVPHDLKIENIAKIRRFLTANEIISVSTKGLSAEVLAFQLSQKSNRKFDDLAAVVPTILVDEMGFLSELYSTADWAYVGGGFGAGIHSIIEPAIYGIPIAIGPKGSKKFSEVSQLQQSGQLTLLRDSSDVLDWLPWIDELEFDNQDNFSRGKFSQNKRSQDKLKQTMRRQDKLIQDKLSQNRLQQNKHRWKREAESRCGGASQILYSLFQGK